MPRNVIAVCAALSFRKMVLWGLITALGFEALTLVLRFGLSFETTRDTAMIGSMTLGLRIHHGYIGLFILLLGLPFPKGIRQAVWIVGIGLILSDLVHHFVVLWLFVGSPQFDFVYPNHPNWNSGSK